MEAQNQILLDDKVGGKGKFFATRFLQPGLVKYSFGVCLLEKETIDKFIYNFVGCPVIINHKDVTAESAKEDRVGVISRVWFNECDGWYYGEGIIFEQEALDLIDKGYNVSCQYEITEYSSTGGLHNGNEYDKTILNGRPEHLAIVENPRYENAMIAVNAIDNKKREFVTITRGDKQWSVPKDLLSDGENYQESDYKNVEKEYKKASKEHDYNSQKYKDSEESYHKTILGMTERRLNQASENYEYLRPIYEYDNPPKQLEIKFKGSIIQATNEIKGLDMFKNLFKKKEKQMDREEIKSIMMECLTELTASNEAPVTEEEDKKEEEVAENKCKNEDAEPDYKKLYEDLKAKVEAGNKCKNEEDKEEVAEDKAKNSIDEQMALFSKEVEAEKSTYLTREDAIELGNQLF